MPILKILCTKKYNMNLKILNFGNQEKLVIQENCLIIIFFVVLKTLLVVGDFYGLTHLYLWSYWTPNCFQIGEYQFEIQEIFCFYKGSNVSKL